MKNIKIFFIIFLLSDAALMHGMTTLRTGARRVQAAGKPLMQQPIQPTPTQPTLIPSQLPEIKKTSPFLDQKKLLSGVTLAAAKLRISQAGQYVRNWFNNLMTSWFSAPTAPKPVVVAPFEASPSPFATGIQKRQYSAVAERNELKETAPESSQSVEKIVHKKEWSAQDQLEYIIKKLDAPDWARNYRLAGQSKNAQLQNSHIIGQIQSFLIDNDVKDIEALYIHILNSSIHYDTMTYYFARECVIPLLKIGKLKAHKLVPLIEKFFDKMDLDLMFGIWGYVSDEGDLKRIEKLFDQILPKKSGEALECIIDFSDNSSDLFDNIRLKIFQATSSININSYRLLEALPKEESKRIDALEYYYAKPVSSDLLSISLMHWIIREYFNTVKNEHEKERLCRIIANNMEFISGINFSQRPELTAFLVSALKKNPWKSRSADRFMLAFDVDSSLAKIPSYRHLQTYYQRLNSSDIGSIVSNSYFMSMIQQIMHKEKDLIDQNYEVFYHARRWQYGFLTDVYGMLYEYKSGKDLDDFMFTQLDDPVVGKVSDKFYASETEKRERLIKEGNPFSHATKTNPAGFLNRQALLFLNKFLFGNLDRLGSCSMHYVIENHNMGEIAFSIEEIFNMFGLNDAYQAFADELKQLQQEHHNLSQYGEMLQVAIPKDNVDKSVYYTTSGGPKKEFVSTGDGEKVTTTDIKTILADLDKNPQDIAEFVLVETRDKLGGLNPESGIKVFSYNVVDPAVWTAFKEKEKALFDRIKDWMSKKKQADVARE